MRGPRVHRGPAEPHRHRSGRSPTPVPAAAALRAADPFEPYTIVAVELAAEQMVVLGQLVPGVGVDDLHVGTEVELVLDTLYEDDEHEYLVWKWRPVGATDRRGAADELTTSGSPSSGVGMHPWGKWGRNFVEYGLAARAALADAGIAWSDIEFVAGADTIRNGYPGFIAGATFAQALGWTGARVSSCYAACASGAQAINIARAQILAGLCEVALVVGADTTPKGFFAPVGGERKDDPDWLRFRLLGATNPTYFALYARRRMELFGATEADFAPVKVKNTRHGVANPNARYRKEVTVEEVLASPMVADPLRLLEICATSDGGAALVLPASSSPSATPARRPGQHRRRLHRDPELPPDRDRDAGLRHRLGVPASTPAARPSASIALAAYEEAGIGPEDLDLAEVYDLSSALELDWYENIGLCKEGEAERLLHDGDTTIGGRIPVNPSGGLSCFGEAIPAQAIAQVCELTWQLRGQATGRQVEGATRPHRQPGPVRPRVLGHRLEVKAGRRWPIAVVAASWGAVAAWLGGGCGVAGGRLGVGAIVGRGERRRSVVVERQRIRTIFPNLPPAWKCS